MTTFSQTQLAPQINLASGVSQTLTALQQLQYRRVGIQSEHQKLAQQLIPTLKQLIKKGEDPVLSARRDYLQNRILQLVTRQQNIEAMQSQITIGLLHRLRLPSHNITATDITEPHPYEVQPAPALQ